MFTRRDLVIAAIAAGLTAGAFALADQGPILGSAALDWNSVAAKPSESGEVRTFINSRTATLDNLDVHVTTLKPGAAPHPPHKHPHEEILIVKQGTIEALINGEWKSVGPGSVVFLASNVMHGVRNSGTEAATYHVIGFHTAATPAEAPNAQPAGRAGR